MSVAVTVVSLCLLFLLVGGISASVDTQLFKSRFRASRGIIVGLSCQFLLLPFLGFSTARLFQLNEVLGVMLIATTCSPGGAYSNWWCSLFNADLALSVAMTTCSTLASGLFMPLNLFLYVKLTYGMSSSLDWWKLFVSIGVALIAIVVGIIFGWRLSKHRNKFNIAGNIAGVALIVFGVLTSSRSSPIWDKDARFYTAIALPCLVGITVACSLSWCCRLDGPQRVAVTVETCYQNTGIALTLAFATFPDDQRSEAASVPIYYGVVEIVLLPLFLLFAWKLGLTYAPRNDSLCKVLAQSYQPQAQDGGKPDIGSLAKDPEAGTIGAQEIDVEGLPPVSI